MRKSRKVSALLIVAVLLLSLLLTAGGLETVELGGVYVYMPEIRVEVKGELPAGDITAQLGSRPVSLQEAEKYDSAKHTTMYYLLFDLSTSMQRDFSTMKQYVNVLLDGMGKDDRITLMTFGTSVQVLLDGSGDKAEILEAVDAMRCNEGGTLLCDALNKAYHLATDSYSSYDRQYAIAFSDFEDYQIGSTTFQEVCDNYASRMLPLYAICASNTRQANADQFGAMARSSGGDAAVVNNSFGTTVEAMLQAINDMYILRFAADTNITDGQNTLLAIQLGAIQKSVTVPVTKAIADEVPPEVLSAEYRKADEIFAITFSEPLLRADEIASYELLDADNVRVGIKTVTYYQDTLLAELSPASIASGEYTLVFHGITDASQQENPLKQTLKLTVELPATEAPTEEPVQEEPAPNYLLIILIAVAVVLAIVIVVVVLLLAGKKKPEAEEEAPVQREQYQATPAVQQDASYHIRAPSAVKLSLLIRVGNAEDMRIAPSLSTSLVFGRGTTCDVTIDDKKLSRQHFTLVYDAERVLLSDMNSTNGTFLNGIRVGSRREVHAGDKITAGLTEIIIHTISK